MFALLLGTFGERFSTCAFPDYWAIGPRVVILAWPWCAPTWGGAVLTVGSPFSGCGLLDYGLTLAGLEHRWFAEIDPFRRRILGLRWPGVRIFDDIRAVGTAAERVDVIAGGFPCKGGSTAGKRNGFDHPETALWREMRRVIGELRPRFVVVENVANLLAVRDGAVWAEVLADLATLGFDVVWDCVPAAAFGAPHLRDRVIAVATHASRGGQGSSERSLRPGEFHAEGRDQGSAADTDRAGSQELNGTAVAVRSQLAVVAGTDGEAAPNPARAGLHERPELNGTGAPGGEHLRAWGHPVGRGVRVEWGSYGPAIRRWEAVHGRAPEPLVRRVDDRGAMRVERSRLSALGDGVQVQLGELVGRYLMEAEVRARAAA